MYPRIKAAFIFLGLSLLLIFFTIFVYNQFSSNIKTTTQPVTPSPTSSISPTATQPTAYEKVIVKRVIDGDTIELEDKRRVRYIGINTPETKDPRKGMECFGQEASEKNKELVEGKTVYLEKDVSNTDQFGRLLRYVYLEDPSKNKNALFINEYLVKEGYAQVSTFPPDVKYNDLFLKAQKEAQANNKGLWRNCSL